MKKKKTALAEIEADKKKPPVFSWAVPEELQIPPDPIRLRLDFHHQAVVMTNFEETTMDVRIVSAFDIAEHLARNLTFNSGLLPDNTLFYRNTRNGPAVGIYEPPKKRILALQLDPLDPVRRFNLPLPGFIFICQPARAPWVFSVKSKPTKESNEIYKAPLLNVHANGRSCPGTHEYPVRMADIINSFFISFFSNTADLKNRSKHHPDSILDLWKDLDKKNQFPIDDLVFHGVLKDLLIMEMD